MKINNTLAAIALKSGGEAALDGKANQTQLADVETGAAASRAYDEGEYFCRNGRLYRATAAIAAGEAITPGTNCEVDTLGNALYEHAYPKQYWFNIGPGQKLTISIGGGNYRGIADVLIFPHSNGGNLNGGMLHFSSFDTRVGFHGINAVYGNVPSDLSISSDAGSSTIKNMNETYSCTLNAVLLADFYHTIAFAVS